jgi:D-glycero-D-manno-heptose 1,7-bisphosphate phosphatase
VYKKACDCRKQKPGMLLTAAQEFSIDLSQFLMFGDKPSDLSAGTVAGCQSFDVAKIFSAFFDSTK